MDIQTEYIPHCVQIEHVSTHSSLFEMPSSELKLTDDEIHIWFGVLDQPESEFHGFEQTLSIDERMRAGRFHFQEDRNQFIARHGILRMILGHYLRVKAGELRFKPGEHGKPEIAEPIGRGTIHFNLSHSNGAVLLAFARNQEIGVDLEHIRDIPEMEQIVDRFFSAGEKTFYRALSQDMKRDAFLNCWTRKEALVKAMGEGLSRSLDKFDVAPVPGEGDAPLIPAGYPEEVTGWSIRTLRPAREFVGALAVESNCFKLRCFKWMSAGAN